MLTKHIGLILSESLELRFIFNPDFEYQLSDPVIISAPDEVRILVRVPRAYDPRLAYPVLSMETAAWLQATARRLFVEFGEWHR